MQRVSIDAFFQITFPFVTISKCRLCIAVDGAEHFTEVENAEVDGSPGKRPTVTRIDFLFALT